MTPSGAATTAAGGPRRGTRQERFLFALRYDNCNRRWPGVKLRAVRPRLNLRKSRLGPTSRSASRRPRYAALKRKHRMNRSCPDAWCSKGHHLSPAGAGVSCGHGGQDDDGIIADGGDGFQRHVAGALHGPFVVLLPSGSRRRGGLWRRRWGKMPTTSARRLISPLSRSMGLVELILSQCSLGKAHESALATQPSGTETGDGLTVEWTTSGLPEDVSFPNLGGAEGNGAWDCANYWAINDPRGPPVAAEDCAWRRVRNPGVRTTGKPLPGLPIRNRPGAGAGGHCRLVGRKRGVSNGQSDLQGATAPPGEFQTESGGPFCARASGVAGVDTTTGGVDRRNLIAPIINCLAQTALGNIAGAGVSSKTPVAAFSVDYLTLQRT